MLLKIAIESLKPGMYVVNTGLPWHSHPHVYSREGVIGSALRVENLRREGYTEAFVDTEKGSYVFPAPQVEAKAAAEPGSDKQSKPAGPARIVPIHAEIGQAAVLYRDTIRHAREFIARVKQDNIADIDQARPVVEELLGSIARNRDALVGLCKLQFHDEYTYSHCVNVCVLSLAFGYFLGLDQNVLRHIGLAGMCHDLGKMAIPNDVINKPGKLTDAEFDMVRKHPAAGFAMVRPAGADPLTLRGILDHHEKLNGAGYPNGLSDLQISVAGRIISMSDVYDALTSDRAYKKALTPMKALSVMFGMRGQDFHAATLDRFIKCLGIYPVGSVVQLSTDEIGVVSESNPDHPLRPKVTVMLDRDMQQVAANVIDLASFAERDRAAPHILSALEAPPEGLDVTAALRLAV